MSVASVNLIGKMKSFVNPRVGEGCGEAATGSERLEYVYPVGSHLAISWCLVKAVLEV